LKVELTKSGLLRVKELLSLARQGYKLMDQKRSILISELVKYIEPAKEFQARILEEFERAYRVLTLASILLGMETIEEIALGAPEEIDIESAERSVLGVSLPILALKEKDLDSEKFSPFYSVYRTNMALDRAVFEFRKLLKTTIALAELETTIYRLAREIKVTQKRANALEQVIIPELERSKKEIESHLEERERDEFFKLKRIRKAR